MPNWKKVIVSGSDAQLNSLLVDTGSVTVTEGDVIVESGSLGVGLSSPAFPVHVVGSGSVITKIQGDSGDLVTVEDSLEGDLFVVANASGTDLFKVNSSGSLQISNFPSILLDTAINPSTTAAVTESVYTTPISSKIGMFVDYTANSGSNYRAGTMTAVFDAGSNLTFNEVSTTDIGDTSDLEMSIAFSGSSDVVLQSNSTLGGWSIRAIVKLI